MLVCSKNNQARSLEKLLAPETDQSTVTRLLQLFSGSWGYYYYDYYLERITVIIIVYKGSLLLLWLLFTKDYYHCYCLRRIIIVIIIYKGLISLLLFTKDHYYYYDYYLKRIRLINLHVWDHYYYYDYYLKRVRLINLHEWVQVSGVLHSYSLGQHLNKKLSKLLLSRSLWSRVIASWVKKICLKIIIR